MSKTFNEKVTITIGVADIAKRVLTEIQEQGKITKTVNDEHLTAKQTADFLKVDVSSLWRFEKSGYLVPVRIGSKRMYKISDLEAILKGEKIKPKKPQK